MAETVSKVLSRVSGLTEDKVHEIFNEVKVNSTMLESCTGPHKFTIPSGRREFLDDYVCELCNGKVSSIHKLWYERGLEHGRRSAT